MCVTVTLEGWEESVVPLADRAYPTQAPHLLHMDSKIRLVQVSNTAAGLAGRWQCDIGLM